MKKLEQVIKEAHEYIDNQFKFNIKESQIKLYDEKHWQEFCRENDFAASSFGMYIPPTKTAYLLSTNHFLNCNALHELYGHGLYVENISPQDPLTLPSSTTEGFALFLEDLLSNVTDILPLWEEKQQVISKNDIELLERYKYGYKTMTQLGFFGELGLPKYYNNNDIVDTLKHILKPIVDRSFFIVLYGSKKPKSDIDLFIVSDIDGIKDFHNHWLDIYEIGFEELSYRIPHLDISVTDPFFTGELIHGDELLFDEMKRLITDMPITQEAIIYNMEKNKEQKKIYPTLNNPRDRKASLGYIRSYDKQARLLSQGCKNYTQL